jgi:hypothetical protein
LSAGRGAWVRLEETLVRAIFALFVFGFHERSESTVRNIALLVHISAGTKGTWPATEASTAPATLTSHQNEDQDYQDGSQKQFIHLFSYNIIL